MRQTAVTNRKAEMADTEMADNVHEITEKQRQRERDRKVRMIKTLNRRQDERRLFLAEISNIIERRQREIDALQRDLDAEL